MTKQRLSLIKAQAMRLFKQLNTHRERCYQRKRWDEPTQSWQGTGEWITVKEPPQNWLRRQSLAHVTLEEHQWLCRNRPNIARFTRVFDYGRDEYLENSDLMSPSHRPVIREIWVGARTLSYMGGEDEPEGHISATQANEDQAELTDLQTMLYEDARGFDQYVEKQISEACRAAHKPAYNWVWRNYFRRIVTRGLIHDKAGNLEKCMIHDPETGEYRPLRTGDSITVARGSNDNLDALFLEEGDDPRQQNDAFEAEGTDHKWSGRFRANTGLEHHFLTSPCRATRPTKEGGELLRVRNRHTEVIPNNAWPEGMGWHPDDMEIRALAIRAAERLIARNPAMEDDRLILTNDAEAKIRQHLAKVSFGLDGQIDQGYFVTRSEFFAELERHRYNRKRPVKGPPKPVDWWIIKNEKPADQPA